MQRLEKDLNTAQVDKAAFEVQARHATESLHSSTTSTTDTAIIITELREEVEDLRRQLQVAKAVLAKARREADEAISRFDEEQRRAEMLQIQLETSNEQAAKDAAEARELQIKITKEYEVQIAQMKSEFALLSPLSRREKDEDELKKADMMQVELDERNRMIESQKAHIIMLTSGGTLTLTLLF